MHEAILSKWQFTIFSHGTV